MWLGRTEKVGDGNLEGACKGDDFIGVEAAELAGQAFGLGEAGRLSLYPR